MRFTEASRCNHDHLRYCPVTARGVLHDLTRGVPALVCGLVALVSAAVSTDQVDDPGTVEDCENGVSGEVTRLFERTVRDVLVKQAQAERNWRG